MDRTRDASILHDQGDIVIILPNQHQGEDVDVMLIKEILKAAGIHVMNGFRLKERRIG